MRILCGKFLEGKGKSPYFIQTFKHSNILTFKHFLLHIYRYGTFEGLTLEVINPSAWFKHH